MYSAAFSPKRSSWKVSSVAKTAASMSSLSLEDKEAGYWKKEYIARQIASVRAVLSRVLQPVSPYTGLPRRTKEALRYTGAAACTCRGRFAARRLKKAGLGSGRCEAGRRAVA
ncbi:F-box only protein 15 [Galemys pyrenaicus]|uniref:F-box only protein 15 n=1 Tax=Galemys pyrenaicus TaxID=202257 RepID=A0A8J5ZLV7_GALPY|nr:F-box only protein 15 [Galemys pyrenaicus]